MRAVILQTVEVLVALAADFAAVGLLLLHANGAWIGDRSDGVDDGECAVVVLLKLLVLMAVLRYS